MIKYFPLVRTSYEAADRVQQRLSRELLDYKKLRGPVSGSTEGNVVDLAHKSVNTQIRTEPLPIRTTQLPNPTNSLPIPSMAMLAYEMQPTYTLGRRQKRDALLDLSHSIADSRPFEIVQTLRGGHTTFHGPGQLVLYPILDLQRLGIKVRDYVCILEKSIVSVLGKYGITAEQRPGAGLNGVWIAGTLQKIASVGVHVRRNVTSHGLALNVDLDPFWFQQIVACNLPDAEMVSMRQFTERPLSVEAVSDELVAEICGRIGVSVEKYVPTKDEQGADNDIADEKSMME